jgi:class 3 adenylate cyclase
VHRLSIEELARRAGTTAEGISWLLELGILAADAAGTFPPTAINRVRLAEALDREGLALEDIGEAVGAGHLSFDFLDQLLPHPSGLLEETADELAGTLGLSFDDLARLYRTWSLPAPEPGQRVREDDARTLDIHKAFPDAGMDAAALVAATRFFGDNTRRIAQSQVEFFKANVIDRLYESGMPAKDVLDTVAALSAALQPAGRELLMWLHARHLESEILQEVVVMLERAMEEAGYARARPLRPPAIAFLDLSGYTRLTEESGDQAAARLAERLAELVAEASGSFSGQVVKTLGDGVMFTFARPGNAVLCGLAMVERADEFGLPRARMGVNAGEVVFRDGDYFGRTVNVAARIVDFARPGEVLVSEDALAVETPDGVEFREVGPVLLRGLENPVTVFRALRANPGPAGNGPLTAGPRAG